jgi:hypothetical protein
MKRRHWRDRDPRVTHIAITEWSIAEMPDWQEPVVGNRYGMKQ